MIYLLRQLILVLFFCVAGATYSDDRESRFLRSGVRILQKLKYRGSNPSFRLSQCEGDCDRDSDCSSGLVCYQKSFGGTGAVPGCSGIDSSSADFCVDPGEENLVL